MQAFCQFHCLLAKRLYLSMFNVGTQGVIKLKDSQPGGKSRIKMNYEGPFKLFLQQV